MHHLLWFIKIYWGNWNWTDSFEVCKHNESIRKISYFHNVVFIRWKDKFSKMNAKNNSIIAGKFVSF